MVSTCKRNRLEYTKQIARQKVWWFFARNPVAGEGIPIISLKDNAVAAHFLTDLAYFTKAKGDQALLKIVKNALKAVGSAKQIEWEGRMIAAYTLALKRKLVGPMKFSIVGNPEDPTSKALFKAASRVYEPRKIIKYEPAGCYPNLGNPALYACTEMLCSQPIFRCQITKYKDKRISVASLAELYVNISVGAKQMTWVFLQKVLQPGVQNVQVLRLDTPGQKNIGPNVHKNQYRHRRKDALSDGHGHYDPDQSDETSSSPEINHGAPLSTNSPR